MAETLNDKAKQLDEITKKIEHYKDVIAGLEGMNYDILGDLYDEKSFNILISGIRTMVKELENAKKSSDMSVMASSLTTVEARYANFASNISDIFSVARDNIKESLGLLNKEIENAQGETKLHSIGGAFSEQLGFIRDFDVSRISDASSALSKYVEVVKELGKESSITKEKQSLDKLLQSESNKLSKLKPDSVNYKEQEQLVNNLSKLSEILDKKDIHGNIDELLNLRFGDSFKKLPEHIKVLFANLDILRSKLNDTGSFLSNNGLDVVEGMLGPLSKYGRELNALKFNDVGFSDFTSLMAIGSEADTERSLSTLSRYVDLIYKLIDSNNLLQSQKSLNTLFQTQGNSDLNALLGKDIRSSESSEYIAQQEHIIQDLIDNKAIYTDGTIQGEKDYIDLLEAEKKKLEEIRSTKDELQDTNGNWVNTSNIKGLIGLYNELNGSVKSLDNNREMLEYLRDPFNKGKTPTQLKQEAIDYFIIPDLGDTKAKEIGSVKELKTESQLLDEVKSKREELNNKIKALKANDNITKLKADTSGYTGEAEIEKVKNIIEEYKSLGNIKKEVGSASMEPTNDNLTTYTDNIQEAVKKANNLRDNIKSIKDQLASGNMINDSGLQTFKENIGFVQRVLTDGLQLNLNDNVALHDLEVLKNTAKELDKELNGLSFSTGLSAEVLKQRKELQSTQEAYTKFNNFKLNKNKTDDTYKTSSQRIADLTLESEKLKKALEFKAFENKDKNDITDYLKKIEKRIDLNKQKVQELETLYASMGVKLPDISGIKVSGKFDYLKELLGNERELRLQNARFFYNESNDKSKEAKERHKEEIEKIKTEELAKQERILGNLKNYYSSIVSSAKRELEIKEALGLIKGPEDKIALYNEYLNRTVKGTEEWAKLTNLVKDEQSKLDSSKIKEQLDNVKEYINEQNRLRISQGKDKLNGYEEAAHYNKSLDLFKANTDAYKKVLDLRNEAKARADEQYERDFDKLVKEEQETLTKQLNNIKNFVNEQNLLRAQKGQAPLTAVEEIRHYENSLKIFKDGTKEWYAVAELLEKAKKAYSDNYKSLLAEQDKEAQEAAKKQDELTKKYQAYKNKKAPKQDKQLTLEELQTGLTKRRSELSSVDYTNVKGIDTSIRKVEIFREALQKAINTGEVDKANQLWLAYSNSIDQVLGKTKSYEKAKSELLAKEKEQAKLAQEELKRQEELNKKYQAYKAKKEPKPDKQLTLAELQTGLTKQRSKLSSTDYSEVKGIGKYIDKVNILRSALQKAINTGDIDRANALWSSYVHSIDQVLGKTKSFNIAQDELNRKLKEQEETAKKAQKEREAELEKLEKLYKEALNYQSAQASMGNKISDKDYVNYLRQQAEEYKRLGGSVENYQRLITKANELEKKAYEDSLKAAKDKVNGVLSTVKSLADGVNNAVNKVISIIRQGIQIITRVINGAIKFVSNIGRTITNIIKLFGNLGNRIRQVFNGGTGSANIFKNSITELNSKLTLLKNAFNAVFNNQFIAKGKNLLTSISTLNVVMGTELTDNTIKWAQELESALGISATDLIADLKEVSAVLRGLGMSSEDVYVGARNLGMMSRYLGMVGLAGGNVDQVMSKLTSGMKGMTAAIDDLGLSVRDAEMNSYLKNLQKQGGEYANIATDFSSLNEEARVYVRYSSLISQFTKTYDLSDFAKQLNTSTGRLSILSQTWSSLATTIGVAFTKVGAYLAGFLIPLIKRLEVYIQGTLVKIQNLLNRVGAFFNIDLDLGLDEALNANSNWLSGDNGLDKVNKDLGDTSDKLEEVEENAKKAKGSLQGFDRVNNVSTNKDEGSSGSDFDYSILMNSALDSLDEYAKEAENYFDKLDKNLTDTLDKIKNKMKEIIGEENITKVNKFFGNIKDKIEQAFRVLFGKQTLDDLVFMNSEEGIWADILRFLDDIPQKVKRAIEMVKQLFDILTTNRNKGEAYSLDTVVELNSGSAWGNILSIIESLKEIFIELSKVLGTFIKEEALPWLLEKLGQLAEWVKENKDNIIDILKQVAGFTWDSFKLFVDLVGKLIDFVVKNPGAVVGFFTALLGLKVVSWFTSVAASIGMALVGLEGFNKLLSGTALGKLLGVGATTGGGAASGGILAGISANAGPIAIVIAAIVGLILIIKDLWDTSESFRESIKNIWEDIKESFSGAFESIKEAFNNIKVAFENAYDSYESSGLKQILEYVIITLIKMLADGLIFVVDLVGSLISAIGNLLADIVNIVSGIIDILAGLGDIIVGIFTGDLEKIKEGLGKIGLGIVEIFSGIIQGFVDLLKGLGDVVFDIGNFLLGGLLDGFKSGFDSFMSSIRNFFDKFIQGVKDILGIHSPSTVFADIGVNIVQGLLNGITNTWNTLSNKVSDLCSGLVNGIKNSIKTGWDNITTWVDNQKSALSTGWENTKASVSNGWNNLTSRVYAGTARRITTHASGGSIAGGQLFIANENGTPELIGNITGGKKTNVANNNMIIEAMKAGVFEAVYNANAEIANQTRGNNMNSGNANIKIDGFGLIDQSTLRELARMLAPYLNSNSKNIADVNFTI